MPDRKAAGRGGRPGARRPAILLTGVGKRYDIVSSFAEHAFVIAADPSPYAPARYAARSAWIDRLLHGFMLFIVFNSMIVFESGAIRWAGVAMFAAFVLAWMLRGRFRFSANG